MWQKSHLKKVQVSQSADFCRIEQSSFNAREHSVGLLLNSVKNLEEFVIQTLNSKAIDYIQIIYKRLISALQRLTMGHFGQQSNFSRKKTHTFKVRKFFIEFNPQQRWYKSNDKPYTACITLQRYYLQ